MFKKPGVGSNGVKDLSIILAVVLPYFLQSCQELPLADAQQLTTININVDQAIPTEDKIPMTLDYVQGYDTLTYSGKIERRGGFSISFAKHSYEIDLEQDVSLAGLPEDDDWILNANYIDKSFLRHVLSYEIFAAIGEHNRAPKTEYVTVQLNDTYNGLYVLMEKLDRSTLGIDKSDPVGVIFKEPQLFRESYDGIVPQDSGNFHQQTYPKISEVDRTEFVEGLRDFILDSSDAAFKRDVATVFDLANIVDWHLLLLVSNNSDGILKNFYLYKVDAATPVRIAPWDYDHSFGRDGDNELNLDQRPLRIERSILFARLLQFEWYRKMLKQRWSELNRAELFSVAGLQEKITAKSNMIREFAERNFELWPVDGPRYYDANSFNEEVDIMLRFVEVRHRRLTTYFAEL